MEKTGDSSYWSRHASVYEEGVDYVIGRELREAVARRLSRERGLGALLECGCGAGFYTCAVAPHAAAITATDLSADMLELARDRLAPFEHILLRRADAASLPFESLSFDTVLLANILNTVEFPLGILKESFRVLRYDGLLLAIVYTDYGASVEEKTDLALRYFQKFGLPPPWGLHNFSAAGLRSLLAEARFYVRNVTLMGNCPKALYAQAFKKLRSD